MARGRTLGNRGFSMVEMIVAIGLFTVLMLIITGSFLSIMDASRKARSTRIALDNISGALDYMAREIRLGLYFRCENDVAPPVAPTAPITTPLPCAYPTGGNVLSFERAGGALGNTADQLVFRHEGGQLYRSLDSGTTWEELTAPELDLTDFRFFVEGTDHAGINAADADQPRISVLVRGVGGGDKARTAVTFTLQTTLSARTPNIPPP